MTVNNTIAHSNPQLQSPTGRRQIEHALDADTCQDTTCPALRSSDDEARVNDLLIDARRVMSVDAMVIEALALELQLALERNAALEAQNVAFRELIVILLELVAMATAWKRWRAAGLLYDREAA